MFDVSSLTRRVLSLAGLTLWALAMASAAKADVFNLPAGETSLQFVTVGDPGNAPDTNGLGSVPYTFQMGQTDITVAEYVAFLNGVAKTDPYGLYNPSMSPGSLGLGSPDIIQSGTSGNYTYAAASSRENDPVSDVSWGDAARFCNWLANGQPATGVENASTTEAGSYALNGAVTDQQLIQVTRSATATYVIPTENEWYKAAYYKSGSTNAGYWLFPTQNNTPPSNVLSATATNNANYDDGEFSDPVNILTSVGAFASSPGPYATFDQGGDVFQWTETAVNDSQRVFLGGAWGTSVNYLASTATSEAGGSQDEGSLGFRIAEVPEPSSLGLLAIGFVALMRRRR
jgi:formylglycine-generating enzyme required for sulfatase activity